MASVENVQLLKLYTADKSVTWNRFRYKSELTLQRYFTYYLYVVKQRANLWQTKDISDLVRRGVVLHNIQLFGTKTLRVCV